jgi:hypothetical protein
VAPHVIGLTAFASVGTVLGALLLGWPLWALVLALLLPWLPLFALDLAWTSHHYGRLALFYALVLTQSGHFLEHLAQMTQIHVQDKSGPQARGVFGVLDIEWVHFLWNAWVLVAVLLLLRPFARNPWLWLTLVFAAWHQLEHTFMMWVYLDTGKAGDPGLLAEGGRLNGGLPLSRPDLHFLYNLVEIVLLLIAFAYTVQRTYNAWLARAFPGLAESQLIAATKRLRSIRLAAGAAVTPPDGPEDVYVVSRGKVELVRSDAHEQAGTVVTLGPGDVVAADGAMDRSGALGAWARTRLEVLAVDGKLVRAVSGGGSAEAVTSLA